MATQTFTHFDAFARAIRDMDGQFLLSRRHVARWEHTRVRLSRLSVQCGHEGSGAIFQGTARPGGLLLFADTTDRPAHSANGQRLRRGAVAVIGWREVCLASPGPSDWFTVFIPCDALADDLRHDGSCQVLYPNHECVARLVTTIEGLEAGSRGQAWDDDDPPLAAAVETEVRSAALDCLRAGMPPHHEQGHGRHAVERDQVVRAALARLDTAGADDHVPVAALARAVDVSERTLRNAFSDYFGMSPGRYLRLRKLHQVRRALLDGSQTAETVTQIESRYGIWEFGRFAHEYRSLFGELPSQTRTRQSPPRRSVARVEAVCATVGFE